MKEHKTTIGVCRQKYDPELGSTSWDVDDPMEPAGEGWTMEGSTAVNDTLIWFWVREVTANT